jgi:uncharacterized protein (TIGR02597 family)
MRRVVSTFCALAAFALFQSVSSAQTAVTDPVGFTTTSLQTNSDSFVSIPFTRVPEFVGAISSASGGTITVIGNPWSASQFKYVQGSQPKHYYVLIGASNTKEGHTYAITDNTANSLTVTTTALDDVNGIPANTQMTIIPYWTPATVFPASDANVSFTPTTSPPTYQTLIRVPNYSASGINLPYAPEYYFNNGAWRRVSDASDGSDDPLLPDGYFVIRNANGAPTLPLTCLGGVLLKKIAVPLVTAASPGQDSPVSLVRPLDVALNATGLGPAFGPNDQLLVFDNAQQAFNKSPSATYFYDTRWRLAGDVTSADRGNDIIPLGSGFIIRKVGGSTTFWTNSFPVAAAGAVSRKSHAGTPFDVSLPLFGPPGIECRTSGGTNDYQVLLNFPAAVTFSGASVTSGAGSISGSSGSGTTGVTVNLTGVTTAQRITITLFGVNDGTNTNDIAVRMGVLWGDVTGNGTVSNTDVATVKAQVGAPVSGSNFRNDVNGNGVISNTDVAAAKAQVGASLPPP